MAQQDPLQSVNGARFWGYSEFPSRYRPTVNDLIKWIYIIDFDQNLFCISNINGIFRNHQKSCKTQYFRLDNIPRWLFALYPVWTDTTKKETVYPVMIASRTAIPAEYLADYIRRVPEPKLELLELYQSFSTHLLPVFTVASRDDTSAWRRIQLQLLQQFLKYFEHSIYDSCPSRKGSPFVLRQVAYAILSLTRSAGIKFNWTNEMYKLYFGNVQYGVKTPYWEPPNADSYWLGDILIVLDEHIYFHNGQPAPITKVAIAKAVQLAGTTRTSPDTVVIVFSVFSIIIINIHQTPEGPEVSHSGNLPLLEIGNRMNSAGIVTMVSLEPVQYVTTTIEALMNLFSSHGLVPRPSTRVSRPGNLPTEICEYLFHHADRTAQCDLGKSCRVFRDIAKQYPQFGDWTLLGCTGDNEFVAWRYPSQIRHVVKLVTLEKIHIRSLCPEILCSGFEVELWGERGRFLLNMPLVDVEEVTLGL